MIWLYNGCMTWLCFSLCSYWQWHWILQNCFCIISHCFWEMDSLDRAGWTAQRALKRNLDIDGLFISFLLWGTFEVLWFLSFNSSQAFLPSSSSSYNIKTLFYLHTSCNFLLNIFELRLKVIIFIAIPCKICSYLCSWNFYRPEFFAVITDSCIFTSCAQIRNHGNNSYQNLNY